jgi:hypothetical protein
VPNNLIALIVVVLVLAFVGVFVTVRYGPPKDARRRQVKAERDKRLRAVGTIRAIESSLKNQVGLDLVGEEARRQVMKIISDYRDQELEIEAK